MARAWRARAASQPAAMPQQPRCPRPSPSHHSVIQKKTGHKKILTLPLRPAPSPSPSPSRSHPHSAQLHSERGAQPRRAVALRRAGQAAALWAARGGRAAPGPGPLPGQGAQQGGAAGRRRGAWHRRRRPWRGPGRPGPTAAGSAAGSAAGAAGAAAGAAAAPGGRPLISSRCPAMALAGNLGGVAAMRRRAGTLARSTFRPVSESACDCERSKGGPSGGGPQWSGARPGQLFAVLGGCTAVGPWSVRERE